MLFMIQIKKKNIQRKQKNYIFIERNNMKNTKTPKTKIKPIKMKGTNMKGTAMNKTMMNKTKMK